MKELSLNILDITENSVKARATLTEISLIEDDKTLTIIIKDNGCGMSEDIVNSVTNKVKKNQEGVLWILENTRKNPHWRCPTPDA